MSKMYLYAVTFMHSGGIGASQIAVPMKINSLKSYHHVRKLIEEGNNFKNVVILNYQLLCRIKESKVKEIFQPKSNITNSPELDSNVNKSDVNTSDDEQIDKLANVILNYVHSKHNELSARDLAEYLYSEGYQKWSEVDRLVDKWIGDEKLTQDKKTLRLIETLRDEAKRYERYYFNHEYDRMIAEAKQEAVSKVFEEIEKIVRKYPINHRINGITSVEFIRQDYEELKKKYIKSEVLNE